MKKDIILLDGGVGTSLWAKAEAHGWKKDPVWKYNIEHPEIVAELAQEYADAGAQIVQANTFGANRPAVQRSSRYAVSDVVGEGVRIVKNAVKDRNVRVCFTAGPLTQMMEPFGDLEEDEVEEIYTEMITPAVEAGADILFLETFMDLGMLRVAAGAAKQFGLPVVCSLTFEERGKTIMGNSVEDMIRELTPLGVDAVGLNCTLAPDLAIPVIRQFVGKTDLPLYFKPNAGKPVLGADGKTSAELGAKQFADEIMPALDIVDYIGGCCGTDPAYIRELASRMGR